MTLVRDKAGEMRAEDAAEKGHGRAGLARNDGSLRLVSDVSKNRRD
jgi:hypothetical protein